MDTIWKESYAIRSHLVNLQRKLGLFSALNLLQDAGWEHAAALELDFNRGKPQSLGWVLTRQKLVMEKWPAWGDRIEVHTWLRAPTGAFLYRDFEVFHEERKIGEASSSFVTMDLATRKLVKQDWSGHRGLFRASGALGLEPAKIPPLEHAESLASFRVRNSDLDVNEHVNNTRYAQWILDALPSDHLRSAHVREYEINFLSEAKSGDEITVQRAASWTPENIVFQGMRGADQKVVFVARIEARASLP